MMCVCDPSQLVWYDIWYRYDIDNVIFMSTFGRFDHFTMSTLAQKVDILVTGWDPVQYHHPRFSLNPVIYNVSF